jgi:uncharacterized membrane protein YccC
MKGYVKAVHCKRFLGPEQRLSPACLPLARGFRHGGARIFKEHAMIQSLPLAETATADPRRAADLLKRLKQLQAQLAKLMDDFAQWASPRGGQVSDLRAEVSIPKLPAHPDAEDRKRHVDALLDRYGQCERQPHRSVREKGLTPSRPFES